MRRRDGGRRAKPWAWAVAVAAVLAAAPHGTAGEMPANARLREPAERMALGQAIQAAARQLARTECQGLLDEFTDASGRPLRAALEEQALDVETFLGRVLFYDAPPTACQSTAIAGTHEPGSRVIRVCGRRFQRAVTESSSYAEAIVIHEMLHALGLGENPPTSDHITARVIDRCRG